MKKILSISGILCFLMLAGCRPHATPRWEPVALVRQLASDTTGAFSLVRAYRNQGARGTVAIIGEPDRSLLLARRFQTVDAVNNIDGRGTGDRLPDFSGEVFDVILDSYNAPYTHFLASGAGQGTDSLRECAVLNSLFAMDSLYRSRANDADRRSAKGRAKVLVFASPLLSAYGISDVDTLIRMASQVPLLIDPVRAQLQEAFSDGPVHACVWARREDVSIYEAVFDQMKRSGLEGATLQVLTPEGFDDTRSLLRTLLRRYSERDGRLDVLVVDDFGIDGSELEAELSRIRQELTDEDAAFHRLLSPAFRRIDPMSAITQACYRLLRQENLFTHAIAYPEVRFFETGEGLDGSAVLYGLSQEYVKSSLPSFLDINPFASQMNDVPDID